MSKPEGSNADTSSRRDATRFDAILSLPHACIGVLTGDEVVRRLVPLPPDAPPQLPGTATAVRVALDISGYLRNPRYPFGLSLATGGSSFQARVWLRLQEIPPGEVMTYGELAADLKSGPRAVANACRMNPFPIVVPCHRVVAKNGLGGYAGFRDGWALAFKRWLLAHERGD